MRTTIFLAAVVFGACVAGDAGAGGRSHGAPARARPAAPATQSGHGYLSNELAGPGGNKTPVTSYPGAVSVVTRKMMDDLGARSLCDALRFVPGVTTTGCW